MEAEYICYQGEFFRKDKPFMGLTRAFQYGDGCFESIRSFNNKIPLLDLHFERLSATLDFLRIKTNKDFYKELNSALEETLIRNELKNGARLRLTVFRRGGGKYESQDDRAAYLIEAEESTSKFELSKTGKTIELAKENIIYPTPFSPMKLIGSQTYVLAAIERKSSKADDIILRNSSGELVEATSSNLFVVKGKKVFTPPLDSGCLSGVMRAYLKDLIPKLGYQLSEKTLMPEHLADAEEIFLSNSIQGVSWVSSFNKARYFKKVSAHLTDELNKRLAKSSS